MKKAILLTAYNRPDYLAEVLDSWTDVRGVSEWDFYISIDDDGTEECREVVSISNYFQQKRITNTYVIRQTPKLGVLKHPYVAIDALFADYDFIVRTEDDLIVSDGILEYFDYTSRSFQLVSDVKTVHAFSEDAAGRESVYRAASRFNPWVFGIWSRAWGDLKENWDTDYSTFNGTPGHQAGFDWNFSTRVYPKNGWFGIYPEVSRVKNIGVYGVHGTPDNLPKSPTFKMNNEVQGERFDLQL